MFRCREINTDKELLLTLWDIKTQVRQLGDNPELTKLFIGDSGYRLSLDPDDAIRIATFLKSTQTLTDLVVVRIDTWFMDLDYIAQGIAENTSINKVCLDLDLTANECLMHSIINSAGITDVTLRVFGSNAESDANLARLLKDKKNLKRLALVNWSDFSCKQLSEALKSNTSLLEFDLSQSQLKECSVQLIADALKENKFLQKMAINSRFAGVKVMKEMLETNRSLIYLNLFSDAPPGDYLPIAEVPIRGLKNAQRFKEDINVYLARNRINSLCHSWMMLKLAIADEHSLFRYNVCADICQMIFNACLRINEFSQNISTDLQIIMNNELKFPHDGFYPTRFWQPCHMPLNSQLMTPQPDPSQTDCVCL